VSETSSKKLVVTESVSGVAELGSPQVSKPVKIWAFFGGALLILQLYVWIRWVSGP